ncbi:carboxypeptidase-like regulatory domain-containing protein [Flavobacterium sp. NAS39]|uniref:Carboxypeptidase-like regulatory domain-containing protein n=1 Tax=Flavobacterium taihuense TaxID=2857508 RepID=A0ABS6XV23_9FLAO|nr:carboxypeptidase-like regulatory domain-containing protein [Flavobacterium taihuense]MBW4359688.1 carboxypeptidase-like regulatory domain-containing protein [Flavobacterium taihuense]
MRVKNNFTFLFIFFFIVQFAIAQVGVEKWIKGQVSSNGVPLEGINITNASTKIMVVSDQYGAFSILVKVGDILNFSAVNYEELRKYIKIQEFKMGNIVVDLTPKSIELNEVIINEHSEISAENLGIIPRDQVKLTSQERKLQTAGDFKPIHLLGLLGGMLAVDPILNAINGRTAMLKKAVTVEKKEFLMAKMEGLFEEKYYIETLKIPEEYIKGFQYYCIEDQDFVRSLKDKNKTMSMFLIGGLASSFNKNRQSAVENH